MARPPSASDGHGLVEFDPAPVAAEAEEIYEVNPAIAATPTPGATIERQTTPPPAGAVPAPQDLRASLSGRVRERPVERRRSGLPVALVVVAVLTVGCAGVTMVSAVGWALIGSTEAALEAQQPEVPREFGGVPVERGFRRGDGGPRAPASRPEEPTP